MDLRRRVTHPELLNVGVDGDELDLCEARVDHPVERVQAGAADSDDLDHSQVGSGLAARDPMEPGGRLRERLKHGRRLGNGLEVQGLCRRLRLRLRIGDRGYAGFFLRLREPRDVLDRLLLRLQRLRRRNALGLSLLGLLLRGLGCAEELREGAFTHARAAPSH